MSVFTGSIRALAVAPMLALGLLAATPAAATVTFDFTGVCGPNDCTDRGTGQLVVDSYTPGQQLNLADFVSWTYSSNLVHYSLTSAQVDFFSADFDALPGNGYVELDSKILTYSSDDLHGWRFASFLPSAAATAEGLNAWVLQRTVPAPDYTSVPVAPTTGSDDYGYSYRWSIDGAPTPGVPEPASWALMLVGFGLAGAGLRAARQARAAWI